MFLSGEENNVISWTQSS